LHHRPETIAAVVGDGTDLRARVRYSWEDPVLGSAGGPRRALPLLLDGAPGTFLVINGDTLTDVDARDVVETHRRAEAAVTMALIPNPRPDKYGGVRVEEGRVTGFTRPGAPGDTFHFIGMQAIEPRVFADLPDDVPDESVGRVYPELMRLEPGAIAAHVCSAAFADIGTPADYLETSIGLAAEEGDRLVSSSARIERSAVLARTAVWDDVAIGAHAQLEECIVCDGASVPGHARYRRCALVPAGRRAPRDDERIEGPLLVRSF
jgi:mannose-1-phosphate guanylyltransferase